MITLPCEFPVVLLTGVVLCIECFVIGHAVVVPDRLKALNEKNTDKPKAEHKKKEGGKSKGG